MNKRNFALLFIVTLFVGSLGLNIFGAAHSSAISGKEFKAGNIIDNATFYDANSMNTSQIQAFLNSKVSSCDTSGATMKTYNWNPDTDEVNTDGKSTTTTRAVYGQRYANFWNTHTSDSYGRTRSGNYVKNESVAPYPCVKDYTQKTPAMDAQSGICDNLPASSSRSAAQIIHDVATACGISPKVLIVLLQKEQSLVTDDWPWKQEYVHATGFNCPDGSPCDPSFGGFFYQVYYAAHQYKLYKANPSNYNYVSGQNNYIYYNPDHSCGGSWVYIQNQATAGLYDYTPYQPNPKTLSVGLGVETGHCGAYGNKNFWWLFTDWFGSTHQDYKYSFERLSGPSPAVLPNNGKSLGSYTETMTYGKRIYTFYYDATNQALRLAYWNGNKWSDSIMDGKGSTIPGATTNDVGRGIAITTYKHNLQVYYYDATDGNLRHLWAQGGRWHLETLDGSHTAVSRSNRNAGRYIKALNWNDELQIFYYDIGAGNVRHAWFNGRWHFENLDGDKGSISHYNADVGNSQSITGAIWNRQIQLYYYDATTGNLRHAWWPGDGRWHFENLDGDKGSRSHYDSNTGLNPSLIIYKGNLQLYYYDATHGNLRHAWWPGDGRWHFEWLDGAADSSVIGNVGNRGSNTEAVTMDNKIFVFYYDRDNSSWEEAEYSPDLGWFNQTLDGGEVSLSNSSDSVGGQLSAAVYQGHNLQIFYKDHGRGLAHAWAK